MSRRKTGFALAVLATLTPAVPASGAVSADLAKVLAAPARAADRVRDAYRHPAEFVDFCGIRPGMTVADYMPAGGFYTRILVPYLGPKGHYYGVTPDPASTGLDQFKEFFAGLPEPSRKELATWKLAGAPASILPAQDLPDALAGTFDRIIIIREMHILFEARALQGELHRLRTMLKPDGELCVVQHRARPWADGDYTDGTKGYMRQSDVVGLVESYGFQLDATSELNANPRDSADWPDGVWSIGGVMTGSAAGRAVGDSDRMTLRFRKR